MDGYTFFKKEKASFVVNAVPLNTSSYKNGHGK